MSTFVNAGRRIVRRIADWVLGVHPHNTIFSFNYFNVTHILRFMKSEAEKLTLDGLTIVDVGAGRSPYYDLFAGHVQTYIAVDDAASLPVGEMRPIRQVPGRAEALPLPDACADVVVSHQVLEHVGDPQAALCEMARVLKPGGKLLGSVPHISPVHLEPYDFRRFTDLGLERILGECGFNEISVEGNGGVFQAAALLLSMDWVVTPRRAGQRQGYSTPKALALAPLIGFVNAIAAFCGFVFRDKGRSYANLCWSARRPLESPANQGLRGS